MARDMTWALITNGVRCSILRNIEGGFSEPAIEIESKAKSTHLRDVESDKPGRSFASGNKGHRSAMELGSDPVFRGMQDFARDILNRLERHLRAGDLTRLAILASPKMLGVLRNEMPDSLSNILIFEKDINLMNLSEADTSEAVLKEIGKRPLA